MAGTGDDAGRKEPVSGDEHGAHAAVSGAGGHLGHLADQAAADVASFEDGLALFQGQAIAPPAKRRAGRPLNSPNRATSKVREYLLARGYRDPMELLAAVVAMDLDQLRGLGIDVKDALALQISAADKLMPYFHQAQPKAVEMRVEGARPLMIFGHMAAPKGEGHQALRDVTPQASQIEGAAIEAQAVDINDLLHVRDHD